ncbi:hydrogenase maturation protease [Halochromatium sp.]
MPVLVFGYGNPSRGDDALGPRLIERLQGLQDRGQLPGVELLTDFQLQIEHVLDLVGRERVIFVDAAVGLSEPYRLTPVDWVHARTAAPARDPIQCPIQAQVRPEQQCQCQLELQTRPQRRAQRPPQPLSWTTHQLTPVALADLYSVLYGQPPRLEQLAIGADAFALGTGLSEQAEGNLRAASARLLEELQVDSAQQP